VCWAETQSVSAEAGKAAMRPQGICDEGSSVR
jgi:hypothetical protein